MSYFPIFNILQVVVVFSFFGGLRHTEVMDLSLERIVSNKKGVTVSHNRAKQRSDKLEAKFLVPRALQQGDLD
jgi:hypothetical protein